MQGVRKPLNHGVTFLRREIIKLTDSAIVLACITAFLYCSSTAYTHGYFKILHLDNDLLDRNFHQILYHGMILNIVTIFFIPLIIAFLIYLHSLYIVKLSHSLKKSFSKGRNIVHMKRFFRLRTRKKNAFEEKYQGRAKIAGQTLALSVVFIVAMLKFAHQGTEAAENVLSIIESNKYHTVNVKINNTDKELAYLYCGARNCAGINPKTREITYFPQIGHTYLYQRNVSG